MPAGKDGMAAANRDATCPLGGRPGPASAGLGQGSPWQGREAAPHREQRGPRPAQAGALSGEAEIGRHKDHMSPKHQDRPATAPLLHGLRWGS